MQCQAQHIEHECATAHYFVRPLPVGSARPLKLSMRFVSQLYIIAHILRMCSV